MARSGSRICPPIEGVTFLDDPHETVLATCTVPRGLSELEAEEAEAAEGEEGEGEGGSRGAAPEASDRAEPAADTEE